MSKKDSAGLAEAWINFQRNWWAWDKLDELCRNDADAAWSVLQELTELAAKHVCKLYRANPNLFPQKTFLHFFSPPLPSLN